MTKTIILPERTENLRLSSVTSEKRKIKNNFTQWFYGYIPAKQKEIRGYL